MLMPWMWFIIIILAILNSIIIANNMYANK